MLYCVSCNVNNSILKVSRLFFHISKFRQIMHEKSERKTMASKSMAIQVTADHSKAEGILPGWNPEDTSVMDMLSPNDGLYLRNWKALNTMQWFGEFAKAQPYSFIDIPRYEETHLTYFKCMDLERLVSIKKLDSLGYMPYAYPMKVTAELERVGNTSFQLGYCVSVHENKLPLFKSSVVAVAVNAQTRQKEAPAPWWVEKFKGKETGAAPLRVNLKDISPENESEIIHRGKHYVTASDIDYYGHTNNSTYYSCYFDAALLEAYGKGCLPHVSSKKVLLNSVKLIQIDYISDSSLGESLDSIMWCDPENQNRICFQIFKEDNIIYGQSVELDPTDSLSLFKL